MEATGTTLISRFAAFIGFLKQRIGANGVAARGDRPVLPNPLIFLVSRYLGSVRLRLEALFTRIEAERASGKPRRIAKPRRKPETTESKPPIPCKPTLPRQFGWITAALADTSGCPDLLAQFLCDRDMEAHIASDPRFGRILRPLCHMLGLDLNIIYSKIPPRPDTPPSPDPTIAAWVFLRHPLLPPQPPGTRFRLPRPRKPGPDRFAPPRPPPQQSLTRDKSGDLIQRLFGRGDGGRNFEPPNFIYVHPK